MVRTLTTFLLALATAAPAQSDGEDAAHRADRSRTEQLNRQALQSGKPHQSHDDRAERDYEVARAQYQRDLAAWRERVAACRDGDWSACE